MNILILTLLNAVIWTVIFIHFYYRIFMMSIFNKNRKCYIKFSKDKLKQMKKELSENGEDDSYITFKDNEVYLLYQGYKFEKDGYVIILNLKGRFIEQRIILPLHIFLSVIPIIIYLIPMYNIMLLVISLVL